MAKKYKLDSYHLKPVEKKQVLVNPESHYDDPYGKRSDLIDLKTQKDAPSYNVIGKAGNAHVSQLLSSLKSKQDMVILQEIIGLPKSLR